MPKNFFIHLSEDFQLLKEAYENHSLDLVLRYLDGANERDSRLIFDILRVCLIKFFIVKSACSRAVESNFVRIFQFFVGRDTDTAFDANTLLL